MCKKVGPRTKNGHPRPMSKNENREKVSAKNRIFFLEHNGVNPDFYSKFCYHTFLIEFLDFWGKC